MKIKPLDLIILTLVIIGAINWGLVGFFQYDLISNIFGGANKWISRIIFALIGISGIYCLSFYKRLNNDGENTIKHD